MSTTTRKSAAKKSDSMTDAKSLNIGDRVLVQVDPRQNGGSDVAAGVVTKSLITKDGDNTVNLTVFVDSGENLWLTQVLVVKSAPKDDEEPDKSETSSQTKVRRRVCWLNK